MKREPAITVEAKKVLSTSFDYVTEKNASCCSESPSVSKTKKVILKTQNEILKAYMGRKKLNTTNIAQP